MNELLKPQECCGGVLYLYSSHEHNNEGNNCIHFFVVDKSMGASVLNLWT
jgi:phage-related protein